MTWAILQYDNRPLTEDFKGLQKLNKEYCAMHGYKYYFFNTRCSIPPWWCKVVLANYLLRDKSIDGILWLDMDAVVNTILPISVFLKSGKSFYFSSDPPGWHAIFNAGVWMVKNTMDGRAIMRAWLKCYNPTNWTFDGKTWTTPGKFAGETYEQGAFRKWILPAYRYKLYKYDWEYFQSYDTTLEGVYIYHFAGPTFKTYIPAYLAQRRKNM
jgi:hypothetical protein